MTSGCKNDIPFKRCTLQVGRSVKVLNGKAKFRTRTLFASPKKQSKSGVVSCGPKTDIARVAKRI